MTQGGWSGELGIAARIKMSAFSRGIRVDPSAKEKLSGGGRLPLTLREYATTGGVTLVLPGDVYVNAPFDEWYCSDPEAALVYDIDAESLVVRLDGEEVPVTALPLPAYRETRDSSGRLVTDVAMSHCDRVRLSPILGCAFDCQFCDMAGLPYTRRPGEQLVAALDVAMRDDGLKARHVLISGGTPAPGDFGYYDDTCDFVIRGSTLPVDVMGAARTNGGWLERLTGAGAQGFAINIEIFGEERAAEIIRRKRRHGLGVLSASIEQAVGLTGGNGKVRSLMVAGLEPIESTLAAVKFIADLGADPVVSPFRPAPGTKLSTQSPPSIEFLERLYLEARAITERIGVKLGPRCIPCQHNTLTFPDQSSAYYFS